MTELSLESLKIPLPFEGMMTEFCTYGMSESERKSAKRKRDVANGAANIAHHLHLQRRRWMQRSRAVTGLKIAF